MSAIANPRAPSNFGAPGKSNSINDKASKSPDTNSPNQADPGAVNNCTENGTLPYGSLQPTKGSTAVGTFSTPDSTGASPKTAGKRNTEISNTTKQSIDVMINKFNSFLRERDPSKIPLGSSASTRPGIPGAKGELKYVTHPLVLNARAALMSPEGRQKKPEIANEDEQRGTKLEILFRRRPSLRTPAGSPAGGTMGNEKERISLQHSAEIISGNAAAPRKDISNQGRPETSASANSLAFDRTRADSQDSKMRNASFEKPSSAYSPIVSFKKDTNIVPPSENGTSSPSGPSSRKPDLAKIPSFNPKKGSDLPNGSLASVSPSGRIGRNENGSPSYPQSSPVATRLQIPPYKPKSESPSRGSVLTNANSPRSRNETAIVPAQIPPYQSKRENKVRIAADGDSSSGAASSSIANDAEARIVTSKNGSLTGSRITVPDIPPFKPKNQGPQQPALRTPPGLSKNDYASTKEGLPNGAIQKTTGGLSNSITQRENANVANAPQAVPPGGSSQTRRSDETHSSSPLAAKSKNMERGVQQNETSVGKSVSGNSRSSAEENSSIKLSAKPPLLPTSTDSPSKSKPDVKKSPLDVSVSSTSSSSSTITKAKEEKSKLKDPRKLRLQHTWTLSYDSRKSSKAIYGNKEKYESNLQTICTFNNVADFWGVCNNVPKPSQLENNANYHLFKNGIKPMWEDPANTDGGSWTISFGRQSNSEFVNQCWISLQCAVVGEMLDPENDVCGVVLNRRGRGDRMSVWVRDGRNKRTNAEIRKRLDDLLDFTNERVTIEFTIHEDYLGSGILYGK